MSKTKQPLRAQKAFDDEKYYSESGDDDDEEGYNQGEVEDVEMEDVEEDDGDEEDSEPEGESSNVQNTLRTVDFGTLRDAQDSLARDRQHIHPSRLDPSSNIQSAPSSRTDAEKVNTLRARLAELKSLKSGSKGSHNDNQVKSTLR